MEQHATGTLHDSSDDDASFVIPLSAANPAEMTSKLTYGDAVALLISLQIGSGIFSSPSQVSKHTPGPGFALLVWLVSGLLAWTGAASYAELGTALPVSGGTQEYLKYIFGDGLAFLASWIWILGVKASGMAALSIIATQYWIDFIFGSTVPSDGWQCKVTALTVYCVIVFINMLSINITKIINKFMSILKLSTLLLLVLLTALTVVTGLHATNQPISHDWNQKNWFSITNPSWNSGFWSSTGEYTLAIYAGLWAFSGWDNVNIVTGDLQDAGRNLPKAIHASQPIVIASFILGNICYYMTIPWSEIDVNNAIAVTVGRTVLGWTGGLIFAILVSTACLGSVSVNVFTASRLVVSAAQAGWLPQSLAIHSSLSLPSRSHNRTNLHHSTTTQASPNETPIRAMLFMTCLVTIYMLTGTFATLITFIGLAEYVFFAAATIGLLMLRVKEPHLPRPYKPNILIPIIFSIVSICLVLVGIMKAPAQAFLLGILLIAGLASKWDGTRALWERVSRKRRDSNIRGVYEILPRQTSA